MKVLFVCLGNICRSPMAEGTFREICTRHGLEVEIDSAGIGGWHKGAPPDLRAQQCMARHQIQIGAQRARQLSVEDFYEFDFILCMDETNLADARQLAPTKELEGKPKLMLSYLNDPKESLSVPDPYHGSADGFEHVYQLLKKACEIFFLQEMKPKP